MLLATLSSSTPGFTIVLAIGLILTIMGGTGFVLWLIYLPQKKNDLNDNPHREEKLKNWFSLATSFDIVLVIGLLCRAFLFQPFMVDGASMERNFHNQEAMLVDKVSYRLEPIKRGDVLIFQAPQSPQDDYIKRVIGLPGETIKVANGNVYVNNQLLVETYLTPGTPTLVNSDAPFGITLGADQYFMLGDNRTNSSDSRDWGPLPRQNIIGKAWLVVYPWSDAGIIKNPNPQLVSAS